MTVQDSALHLRSRRQHHPHPRRRPADDLLQQPSGRARHDYTYDALYRLIEATAASISARRRSHLRPTWNDNFRESSFAGPGDPNDCRRCATTPSGIEYDAVGNFEQLIHQAANGNWTRAYAYNEPSLLEPAKKSNRLSSTTIAADRPTRPTPTTRTAT